MHMVFIGGYSRSGTTMLGAMIGAHSRFICTPESQFKIDVLRYFTEKKKTEVDIETARKMILAHPRYRILWGDVADSDAPSGTGSFPDLILWFVRRYAERQGKPDAACWVDHTPTNIKHAKKLLELFPGSKFMHIIRDGRGVSASIIPLDWGPNTVYRTARSWRKTVSRYLSLESELGKDQIMRIRYEDLLRSPESEMRKVCCFLDLEFEPQMIMGGGFKVPRYQDKQHALVGKEPDRKRINAWEKYLAPRQVEIFESIAADLLLSLGYDLRYHGRARGINFFERVASEIREVYAGKVINRFRHQKRIEAGSQAQASRKQ